MRLWRRGETLHAERPIDLLVVNLYPFWEHRGEPVDSQTPFIDIGGPSLIRASAKNFDAVAVLSSPDDYESFAEELRAQGGSTRRAFRHRLAAQAFQRTSGYDAMIASEWQEPGTLPVSLSLTPYRDLRYGENPHQAAALYTPTGQAAIGVAGAKQLQGKELSYNNLVDLDAAWGLVSEFQRPAVAIIKHNNPCGCALAGSIGVAFERALATDPQSAYGGIFCFNRRVDRRLAEALHPGDAGKDRARENEVELDAGSRLGGLLGARAPVKSHHHQGFGRLGEGLRASARADDGTVEALEAAVRRFAVGVLSDQSELVALQQ